MLEKMFINQRYGIIYSNVYVGPRSLYMSLLLCKTQKLCNTIMILGVNLNQSSRIKNPGHVAQVEVKCLVNHMCANF